MGKQCGRTTTHSRARATRVAAHARAAMTPATRRALATTLTRAAARRALATTRDDGLTLTDACAARLRRIADDDASAPARLRLAVEGGGCSGFKYEFTLERDAATARDKTFRASNGAEVVVDEISYEFVRGSTIDYVEEMIKSSFEVVKNPQADATCGCGASFGARGAVFGG